MSTGSFFVIRQRPQTLFATEVLRVGSISLPMYKIRRFYNSWIQMNIFPHLNEEISYVFQRSYFKKHISNMFLPMGKIKKHTLWVKCLFFESLYDLFCWFYNCIIEFYEIQINTINKISSYMLSKKRHFTQKCIFFYFSILFLVYYWI